MKLRADQTNDFERSYGREMTSLSELPNSFDCATIRQPPFLARDMLQSDLWPHRSCFAHNVIEAAGMLLGVTKLRCRPGQASVASADPGPITTGFGFAKAGAPARSHNNVLWLWVPAFAGTTVCPPQ
jgi:hypothetical protein